MDLNKKTLDNSFDYTTENKKTNELTSKKENEKNKLIAAYDIFNSEKGKLVLKDLKAKGFYDSSTLTDLPHQSFAREGSRQLVLYILTKIRSIRNV